jgi:hypothetical protein
MRRKTNVVIPAQAGIHLRWLNMDPGLRQDDAVRTVFERRQVMHTRFADTKRTLAAIVGCRSSPLRCGCSSARF